jgi:cytochrome c5
MRSAVVIVLAVVSPASAAASGEEIYREKCALCHDAGAGQAPRIGAREDWKARFAKGREGLLASAIRGVPGTAMAPKGGFPELAEGDIALALDHLLSRLGYAKENSAPAEQAAIRIQNPGSPVDDATLVRTVGEALAKARIGGVKVESTNGVVALMGVVDDNNAVRAALAAARAVPGVGEIENRLVSAALFEWD